jgi:iron complex outermembrane receptor protein
MTNDRSYETMGVRGFSLPGDYDSHILVMVNGHNMADNIFDYMLFFGNDFPIECRSKVVMSYLSKVEMSY